MIKLAGVQISCSEDKERNIEKAIAFARIAIEHGAHFICFQELFTTHWFPKEMNQDWFALAEPIPGPTLMKLQKIAMDSEVVIICPIFEKAGQTFYNSAVVIDAGGGILGTYRKVHVPQIPLWEERYYFSPGNLGFPIFRTRYAVVGVQICWDNFFPEGSRVLALKGAQLIFSPTAAAFASQEKWRTAISSNAMMNGVFILRVNRVGSEEKQDFYGKSFCVSPEGELVDKPSGMKEGIVLVDIDLKQIDRVRKEWPFLKDRKPEAYQEIVNKYQDDL